MLSESYSMVEFLLELIMFENERVTWEFYVNINVSYGFHDNLYDALIIHRHIMLAINNLMVFIVEHFHVSRKFRCHAVSHICSLL